MKLARVILFENRAIGTRTCQTCFVSNKTWEDVSVLEIISSELVFIGMHLNSVPHWRKVVRLWWLKSLFKSTVKKLYRVVGNHHQNCVALKYHTENCTLIGWILVHLKYESRHPNNRLNVCCEIPHQDSCLWQRAKSVPALGWNEFSEERISDLHLN